MEVPTTLVDRVKGFLDEPGVMLFRAFKEKYGTVSPVFRIEEHPDYHNDADKGTSSEAQEKAARTPWPVHMKEGMQVRNFMRDCGECKGWTDHDFDTNWKAVVEAAIKEE